ncbi:MAG: hypothetical protein GWN99_20440 [Gemmatimonadetes bacterium]|uniref:NHL repeat-containing protein n=1 Tax=Candidatus Kutchimonas denitrificans TaxID=3056748 RepID=A0AAE5CCX6_9BACT|nr:hypothetical protein [Gemmatimonadota bacterium]NIR76623.1 hypothetical protein [Candidatus Kutchimonas denitrificans]NIS03392.1 hypothetical protein [Gemmatimonadota bacterium]NIT69253.1 hypothetical protein [Gemmatimonadota bacterium]NIU54725.1 hypothetical protein [Gemmatimonadota bacterium]
MTVGVVRALITVFGGGLLAAAVHAGSGMAVDGAGRVYFNDTTRDIVYRIEADSSLTVVAEDVHTNVLSIGPDGSLIYPPGGYPDGGYYFSIEAPDGSTYATVYGMVVRVAEDGSRQRIAGDTVHGFRDGPVSKALFDRPLGLAIDSIGSIYVADHGNSRVRVITPDSMVKTVARAGWPWAPAGLTIAGERVYVLERLGKYGGLPILSRFFGFYLDHPRVRAIAADGSVGVVARVPVARAVPYAVTFLMVVVLIALVSAGVRARKRRDL